MTPTDETPSLSKPAWKDQIHAILSRDYTFNGACPPGDQQNVYDAIQVLISDTRREARFRALDDVKVLISNMYGYMAPEMIGSDSPGRIFEAVSGL